MGSRLKDDGTKNLKNILHCVRYGRGVRNDLTPAVLIAPLPDFDSLDDTTQRRLRFEQSWLYSLIIDFISILHTPEYKSNGMLQPAYDD